MEQKQNPYEFHLSEEEVTYNSAEAQSSYQTYADTIPNASTGNIVLRKKQCYIISLVVMSAGLFISLVSSLLYFVLFHLAVSSDEPEMIIGLFFASFVSMMITGAVTNHFISKRKLGPGIAAYVAFCITNGITFMSIFANYAPASILGVYLFTMIVFGGTALIALIIPKDLSGWASSLIMGLFALLLLSLISLFLPGLESFNVFICMFGIVLFIGLTAYDTQKIRKLAETDLTSSVWIIGLYGGMNLYLDFLNLLLKILRLFGRRK